jgi:hypothetical protein
LSREIPPDRGGGISIPKGGEQTNIIIVLENCQDIILEELKHPVIINDKSDW